MRPRFRRGPLQMIGWLVALVYNAVADLAADLDGDYEGCHVSTLQRKFFNRPGRLYSTPEALIVYLDAFRDRPAFRSCPVRRLRRPPRLASLGSSAPHSPA